MLAELLYLYWSFCVLVLLRLLFFLYLILLDLSTYMPFSFFTLFPCLHTGPFACFLRRTALRGWLWVSDGNRIVIVVCLKMSLFRLCFWRIFTEYLRLAVTLYKHFKDLIPCLLASTIYVKTSAVSVAPWSAMYLVTMAAFEIFFVFNFQNFE